jgi:hypothetical protein
VKNEPFALQALGIVIKIPYLESYDYSPVGSVAVKAVWTPIQIGIDFRNRLLTF